MEKVVLENNIKMEKVELQNNIKMEKVKIIVSFLT